MKVRRDKTSLLCPPNIDGTGRGSRLAQGHGRPRMLEVADVKHRPAETGAGPQRPSAGMIAVCVCLGVVLLVGVVYLPVLTAGFVDRTDRYYVFEVGRVRSMDWHEVASAFQRFHRSSAAGLCYQPLTALSLMLDAYVVESNGDWTSANFYFHLTNLLLHVLNTALLFGLARRLSGSTFWAALGALIFGLHPLQVESVAWVAQRPTLLATLFSLLALICYTRYGTTQRIRWFAAVTFCYAAAILSKPTFVGLPVVFLVLDVWPLRRLTWRPIVEKTPLFLLLIACGVVHYHLQSQVQPIHASSLSGLELMARNITSFAARIAWPVGLSPFYPIDGRTVGTSLSALADVAVGVVLIAAIVAAFRFSRPLFVALAGSVVLVFPGLFNAPFSDQLLGDQYLYAVLVVPVLAWAAWVKTRGNVLRRPWGRCVAMALAAIALVFSVRSNIQTYVWQSGRDLFLHTVSLYPRWSRGYVGLVECSIRNGDLDSALYYAEKAVHAVPDDPSTQFYLGRVLLLHQDGRSIEAIGPLRTALASDPDWIDCLHYLGVALADVGQVEEAIVHLERARDLQPRSAAIRIDLGTAYLKMGRAASARAEFQLAAKEGNDPMANLGLAKAWAVNGNLDYARRHLAVAVALNPRSAVLAARYPELRRLRHEPGFESLIDTSEDVAGVAEIDRPEMPPARSGPGL
ncbi:MAG: tetratricopeptide repeat protein [Phycisphaerae bacterium]|nr:tetratricopeptide repeat protein [Phycisphaerae bacterium]